MNFFFDNNLAPKIAKGLHQFVQPEHAIVHLKDQFAANIEDQQWMRGLATRTGDWIIITADIRIGRNPHEIQAWKEAGHTIFFLKPGWTDMPFWIQAAKFTKCFPDIISAASRARHASAFLVATSGKIEEMR